MAVKEVGIIGCGVSGLTAIKCCLDAGLQPTCFEQQSWLGGLWNYTDEVRPGLASVHGSTVTNHSKAKMAFSDFPMPKEFPNYLPHRLLEKYLEMYAKHFDLEKYIYFSTTVERLERSADHSETGKWVISYRKSDETNFEVVKRTFDAVMVCNGAFWDQFIPDFPGRKNFQGTQVHSGDYRTFHPYVGKRVMVIGCSNSGADIAVELSRHAAQVYLSSRNGCYIFARLGAEGFPFDYQFSRIGEFIPAVFPTKSLPALLNEKYDFQHFGLYPRGTLFYNQFSLVNDELPHRIITGSIVVKDDVEEIKEKSVVIKGGEVLDNIDVLVFATGFKPNLPFAKDIIEVKDYYASLYKHVFLPDDEKHTLAAIGLELVEGPVPSTSEMQARVAAEVFAGRCKLPSMATMKAEIEERLHRKIKAGVQKSSYMREMYIPYMDELAEMIGARPKLWSIFMENPKLALRCLFGPMLPAQYRLQGPNSWNGAKLHIEKVREDFLYPLSTRKCPSSGSKNSNGFLFVILVLFVAALGVILKALDCV